jgi:predicted metal-dependent hydrolase
MIRTYRDIQYTLKRSNRKTASIYVERDGQVTVIVPKNCPNRRSTRCWRRNAGGFTRAWPSGTT